MSRTEPETVGGMGDTTRAGIGSNSGDPLAMLVNDAEQSAADHEKKIEELCAAANAWCAQVPKITTAAQAERCESFLVQLRAHWKAIDDARKVAKGPFDAAAANVQAAFTPLLERLVVCADIAKKLKKGYLDDLDAAQQAEAKRAREEAARLQREADDAHSAAEATRGLGLQGAVETSIGALDAQKRADAAAEAARTAEAAKPQVRDSVGGKRSGFTTEWKGRVDDLAAAAAHYATIADPKMVELVQGLANRDARAMKNSLKIPGVVPVESRRV